MIMIMIVTLIILILTIMMTMSRADVKSCAGECKNRVYCRSFGFRCLSHQIISYL